MEDTLRSTALRLQLAEQLIHQQKRFALRGAHKSHLRACYQALPRLGLTSAQRNQSLAVLAVQIGEGIGRLPEEILKFSDRPVKIASA